MISINYQDSRPIYEQIVSGYQKLIFRGVLRPDERIPSVRSMAATLTANPNTVQKAYAELERQGFIYTVRGRGNFVCGDPRLIETNRRSFLQSLKRRFWKRVKSVWIRKRSCVRPRKDTGKGRRDEEGSGDGPSRRGRGRRR